MRLATLASDHLTRSATENKVEDDWLDNSHIEMMIAEHTA